MFCTWAVGQGNAGCFRHALSSLKCWESLRYHVSRLIWLLIYIKTEESINVKADKTLGETRIKTALCLRLATTNPTLIFTYNHPKGSRSSIFAFSEALLDDPPHASPPNVSARLLQRPAANQGYPATGWVSRGWSVLWCALEVPLLRFGPLLPIIEAVVVW